MAPKRMDAGRGGRPDVVKQARGAKSRRGFYLSLLAIAVLGIAGITWATQRSKAGAVVTLPAQAARPGTQAPGYVRGDPNAPVEIVEYADFECPACGQYAIVTGPDVKTRLVDAGLARIRLYDFPVTDGHRNSAGASLAAACASDQNRFWEMHDLLFQGQNDWNSFATDDPKSVFRRYAVQLGLDADAWEQCYDGRKHVDRIAAHAAEAQRAGLRSTPSFVIGNRMLSGAQPFDVIKAVVDSVRAEEAATPAAGGASRDTASRTPVPAAGAR